MSTPVCAQTQQKEFFRSPQEVAFILNLRLAGRSSDDAADRYAREFPDQRRPDSSTVRRFLANNPKLIEQELKKIKPGVLLAEVRSRLALLQDLIYESVDAYREHLGSADPENLAYLSKLFDKIIKGLNEMAVQCGDTLVSQLPQGSGDRPQVFQSVYVEKLVNQTLVVSDDQAAKQGGAKKAGGELLSPQSAVSDADSSTPAA